MFVAIRRPAESDRVDAVNLLLRISSRLAKHAIGELRCELSHARVIHQMQRLRSDQRFGALQAIRIHRGQIKTLQQRGRMLAKLLHVNAPPLAAEYEPVRSASTAWQLHARCG